MPPRGSNSLLAMVETRGMTRGRLEFRRYALLGGCHWEKGRSGPVGCLSDSVGMGQVSAEVDTSTCGPTGAAIGISPGTGTFPTSVYVLTVLVAWLAWLVISCLRNGRTVVITAGFSVGFTQ